MASVTLRKSDKLHALNAMTRAKFQERYNKLIKRRQALTQRVYDETLGMVGYKLKAAAASSEEVGYWLNTKQSLHLIGVPVPGLLAQPEVRSSLRRTYHKWELFSGESAANPLAETHFSQQLETLAVYPAREFSSRVHVDKAWAATRKVAAALTRDIKKFNKEVAEFYDKADDILYHIRSTKKVDQMIPELWEFLPLGLRERVKQGVIALDQSAVDELRKQMPKKRRG